MNPDSDKNVSGLVVGTTNMDDGPSNVSTESLDAFPDDINEPRTSLADIVEPRDYIRAIQI